MANPTMQNIPGMDAVNGTLDFVKNLWGGMSMPGMKLPGMIMPTLSVEEINKQIADLKTVESWLTLNLNMLKSTIQALEVQSATISTLQAMGESLSAAVTPPVRDDKPVERAAPRMPEPAPEPAPQPEVKVKPEAQEDEAPETGAPGPSAAGAVPLANPALWWNMLQDQFKQAVTSAMAGEGAKPEDKPLDKPATKSAPRSAAKPAKATGKTVPKAAPRSKPGARKTPIGVAKPAKRKAPKDGKEI